MLFRAIPSQLSDAIRYHQQLIRQSNMATTNATSQSSAAPHVRYSPLRSIRRITNVVSICLGGTRSESSIDYGTAT